MISCIFLENTYVPGTFGRSERRVCQRAQKRLGCQCTVLRLAASRPKVKQAFPGAKRLLALETLLYVCILTLFSLGQEFQSRIKFVHSLKLKFEKRI